MKTFCSVCFLMLLACLSGCGKTAPDTTLRISTPVAKAESGARFEVERVGVFEDSLAYGAKRGIYILKDTHTGKEYVGVSGIGISELGSHTTQTMINDQPMIENHPDER